MTLAGNVYNLTPAAIMRQQDSKREPIAFEFIPTKDTDYHAIYRDIRRGIRNLRGELIPAHLRRPFVYTEYLAYYRKKIETSDREREQDLQDYLAQTDGVYNDKEWNAWRKARMEERAKTPRPSYPV